ncbi:ABC transporter ATP-binding protein [Pediococcus pentosaceus]
MNNIVEVNNLNVQFEHFEALKDVNFHIQSGAGVIGLIGPNGAGKTTLIHSILGQLAITKGTINTHRLAIAYCPDTPSFDVYLTAEEVLQQVLELRDLPINKVQINQNLEQVGLLNHKKRLVGRFSRGMKQRLGIAVANILEPKLLILDEPTSALDPFGREDILALITKIAKERTVLISSHLLSDIQRVANRLLVLHQGSLLFDGSTTDFIHNSENMVLIKLKNASFKTEITKVLTEMNVALNTKANFVDKIYFPVNQMDTAFDVLKNHVDAIERIGIDDFSLDKAFDQAILKEDKL